MHKVQRSQRDGTAKYLFRCEDGQLVESVFLPHEGRNTACLSTQVGCAMGCKFCATGESGFARNLTPGEIVAQVIGMEADQGQEIHNLVLMGMGEPLHNWENVRESMSALLDPAGRNWGPRKITLSTCGVVSGIDKLTESGLKLRLAVSLHSADDQIRSQIMPINQRYPLKELLPGSLRKDYQKSHRAAADLRVHAVQGPQRLARPGPRRGQPAQRLGRQDQPHPLQPRSLAWPSRRRPTDFDARVV